MGAMGGAEEFRVGPDDDRDRYRLERLHSSGTEGKVWRGSLELDDEVVLDVAVKILHAERQDLIAEWRAKWTEQVELLRSLQYPGVVTVREAFEGPVMHPAGQKGSTGRSLYLVMNWMEGEPLHEWVSDRPQRNVFDALRLLTQVADALDYMHSGRATGGKPVVHRDIKPANIIVSGEAAVLVDFGLVRALTKNALQRGIGTVEYMAPEIVSDGEYSPASDRYALGCVAYYMLTGANPPDEYDFHVMRANLAKVPALGANASLLNHFMTMLDPVPDARPPQASAWVQMFRSSTRTEPGRKQGLPPIGPMAASIQPPTIPPGRPPRRRSSVVATLAIIAALLGGTAIYAAVRQSRSPTEVESGAPGQQVPSTAGSSTTQRTAVAAQPDTTDPIPVTTAAPLPQYRPTYPATVVILNAPHCRGSDALVDVDLPKVSTEDDLAGMEFTYQNCMGATIYPVQSVVAALSDMENPTPADCAVLMDRQPLPTSFLAPTKGQTLCLRTGQKRIATLYVIEVSDGFDVMTLRLAAWEWK